MTQIYMPNGEVFTLPDKLDLKTLNFIAKTKYEEGEKQQDKILEDIFGNNPNKRPRVAMETCEQTPNEILTRIDALEKQQKEHKIQQQFIERIKKYVANQIYDENGNLEEGESFFGNPYVLSEHLDEAASIYGSPLETIEYRQYISPTGFILDLLGFLGGYMEISKKGLEYGRAYEVRRFAIDEFIRIGWAQEASSEGEERYSPQVYLFPMKPMSKEDVKKCFSYVDYPQGKAMTPISVLNARSAAAYAQENIVKNLYKDYYEEMFG